MKFDYFILGDELFPKIAIVALIDCISDTIRAQGSLSFDSILSFLTIVW